MTEARAITVAFGRQHPAEIVDQQVLSWEQYAAILTALPPVAEDKASRGWSIPAEFQGRWRDADNLTRRHCLTFDFDHMQPADMARIDAGLKPYEYAIYTTASHTAEKPRLRIVLPLSRSVSPDEFQAISRKLAEDVGMELVSRESHVPAQMMFLPTRKRGGPFKGRLHKGQWVDADAVLARYADWTDRFQWPRRASGDPLSATTGTDPEAKVGPVGDFCRAFKISEAIEKFELPYHAVANDRWTYIHGSRPEGAVVYDDDTKLHSHHDTDPARGQHNSFDLVRLHKYGHLDAAGTDLPVTELPSYKAMLEFIDTLPEVQDARTREAIALLPDLPAIPESVTEQQREIAKNTVARPLSLVLAEPTVTRWLLPQRLEAQVIAVMAGPRGTYKSFVALDWAMQAAMAGHSCYVISAEGGDFDRRARAWLTHHQPGVKPSDIPLFVVERRLDLSTHAGIEAVRQDCQRLGVKPRLFVLDTYSKLSGGIDENDNSAVKTFIGRLDNGLKRSETGFGATVLLIAHTGHSDKGRPRGASAFAADTDAEYIMARNPLGGVRISRERFKSSPELPPLYLSPTVVPLGYKDSEGQEVTSLVLTPSDPMAHAAGRGVKLKGPVQKLVFDTANKMLITGELASHLLVDAVVEQMAKDPTAKRDIRHQSVRKAIDALVAAGALYMHKGNRLSLSSAPELGDDE